MAIVRTAMTDDDGTGTTGTIFNNAWKTSLYNEIDGIGTPAAFTTVWNNTGTANALVNGTLTASWTQVGYLVFWRISLLWGTSTTSGSGNWKFTLPISSDLTVVEHGFGRATDAGTGGYKIIVRNIAATEIDVGFQDAADGNKFKPITATAPFTWTNGDSLAISGWYFKA